MSVFVRVKSFRKKKKINKQAWNCQDGLILQYYRPPPTLSSTLTTFDCFTFLSHFYRERYGFERAFFTHRHFLPYAPSQHLAQLAKYQYLCSFHSYKCVQIRKASRNGPVQERRDFDKWKILQIAVKILDSDKYFFNKQSSEKQPSKKQLKLSRVSKTNFSTCLKSAKVTTRFLACLMY